MVFDYSFSQWWPVFAMGMVFGLAAFIWGRRAFRPVSAAEPPSAPVEDFDPFTDDAAGERRIAPRRSGNPVKVEIVDPEGAIPPTTGWVADRSLGGLCLDVERAVPVGADVCLKIHCGAVAIPPIPIAVKSCRASGTGWRIGCEFVKPPSFNVLLMLG